MTNKNSPVRIIDQKGTPLVKNPPATTAKFNPYTGSLIKQGEAKSYGVWLRSTGGGLTRTIPVTISATDTRLVFIRIAIPNVVVRLDNPNYTLEKLKFFFTFSPEVFNQYLESQYFLGNDDNLDKIVTLDSTSVLSLRNTSGQGALEISAHIARLFRKYTLADLVILVGAASTTEGLSSDDLLRLFKANESRLVLHCQVGFQDLVPLKAGRKVPYVKRTNTTVQFTFSDERLQEDSLGDINFSVEGTEKIIQFTKKNISRIEYSVYSISFGARVKVLTGFIGPLRAEQDQFKESIKYTPSITDFSWINNLAGSEQQLVEFLHRYSRNLQLSIDRVVTAKNVSYTGTTLRERYGLDEFYTADTTQESFVKPSMRYSMKYSFTKGTRTFVVDTGGPTQDVVGFAIIYTGASSDGGITYPSFSRVIPKKTQAMSDETRYVIVDGLTSKFYPIPQANLRITIYTLLSNAHVGSVVVQFNSPPRIRLQKLIPTQTQNVGYFNQTIKLSTDKNSIVFNEFGKRGNALEAITDFNLVVQRLVGTRWVTLTNGIIQCTMEYNPDYTGVRIFNAQGNQISSISIARLTSARGTYRVLAEPKINAAYSLYYESTTSLTRIQFTR
jgi:hypothetical protein